MSLPEPIPPPPAQDEEKKEDEEAEKVRSRFDIQREFGVNELYVMNASIFL